MMRDNQSSPPEPAADADQPIAKASTPRRRVRRRRLLQAAVATGAGVVGASGAYVRPSVRPLQLPRAQAFCF